MRQFRTLAAALLISVISLCAQPKPLDLVPGSLAPTVGDVSNGFYPHLAKIDAGDPAFLDVVGWLVSEGAPRPRMKVSSALTVNGAGRVMPTELVFETPAGGYLPLDAALVYNFPHVALAELKITFGFGDARTPVYYPGRTPTPVPTPARKSPIGAAWPEEGANAYRPSAEDRGIPEGEVWVDGSGRYRKAFRRWVFVQQPVWLKE